MVAIDPSAQHRHAATISSAAIRTSHQRKDASDVPLKVDHPRTILVQIGKKG